MSAIGQFIEELKETSPKEKMIWGVALFCGVGFVTYHYFTHGGREKTPDELEAAQPIQASTAATKGDKNHFSSVLPGNTRNQGLEDLQLRLEQLEGKLDKINRGMDGSGRAMKQLDAAPQSPNPGDVSNPVGTPSATVNLDKPLPGVQPGQVSFDEPAAAKPAEPVVPLEPPKPEPRVWDSGPDDTRSSADEPPPIIPVNSAMEAVMLTGLNARPAGGATTGAAGSSVSALNVGAPFVTKLKGNAILPNGWKVSLLGDCFLSGSATANLSSQRANAIADKIACVSEKGEVWEASVKAYAVDVDGIPGISGKIVNKQGTILLQSLLSGIAGGLGSALAPTSITAYNSNASSGSTQGYQLPSVPYIAGTALGQGISTATSQLSRFYLEYAREIIPTIEVTSMTRVTWVLKDSLELKKSDAHISPAVVAAK